MSPPSIRGRFSDLGQRKIKVDRKTGKEAIEGSLGPLASGIDPDDLWGVSQRDRSKPRRRRSASASARRRAKKAAKRAGVSLKAWLSSKALRMGVGR